MLLVMLLVALWPGPVAAHLGLKRTEPANGAVLETSPETVELWFSAELDTFESSAAVFDAAGQQVDLGDAQVDLDDRTLLQVGLPVTLPPGAYTVRWIAVDDIDGHPTKGELEFTIAGKPPSTATWRAKIRSAGTVLLFMGGFIIAAGLWSLRRRKGLG